MFLSLQVQQASEIRAHAAEPGTSGTPTKQPQQAPAEGVVLGAASGRYPGVALVIPADEADGPPGRTSACLASALVLAAAHWLGGAAARCQAGPLLGRPCLECSICPSRALFAVVLRESSCYTFLTGLEFTFILRLQHAARHIV